MFATIVRLSKASRAPLTPKRGNKDYYKGTRQSAMPGGPWTGAPGKHVVRGKAKYRLVDEKVRYFVAPPVEEIENSPLRPYVHRSVKLTTQQRREIYGELPRGGLTGSHYFETAPRFEDKTITVATETASS